MRLKSLLSLLTALLFSLTGLALADDHGHDHDRYHRADYRYHHYYDDHDRDRMRGWYHEHHDHLPPGLAKRDRLPPGLERQLVVRGTLPPGLRRRMMPCPVGLERELPPPPPGCAHMAIGGHIVLVNRSNFMVLDVFHFEL